MRQQQKDMSEVSAAYRHDIAVLREAVIGAPNEDSIQALERMWQQDPAVVDLTQLAGEWELRLVEDRAVRGWLSGDITHRLISLYSGNLAKVLRMKLGSTPTLKIWRSGEAEARVRLQWGFSRDDVAMQSNIVVTGANRLRASPQAVKSSRLRVKLPLPTQDRSLRITYFDGQLLIIRDSSGVVEILSRPGGKLRSWVAPDSSIPLRANGGIDTLASRTLSHPVLSEDDSPEIAHADDASGSVADVDAREEENTATAKVSTLTQDIEALRTALEIRRAQAESDREKRRRLEVDVHRKSLSLGEATSETEAEKLAVEIFEVIENRTSDVAMSQRERSEKHMQQFSATEQGISAKEESVATMRSELEALKIREDAIQLHMRELNVEIRGVPRRSRAPYRSALAKARIDLQEVRRSYRDTARALKRAEKQLAQTRVEMRRSHVALEQELAAREHIESQLEGQRRQYVELKSKHADAMKIEQELTEELEALQKEYRELEAREAEAREFAEAMEGEVTRILSEASKVKKLAHGLKSSWRARVWPLR